MNDYLSLAKQLYEKPLFELIYEAHGVHRANHNPAEIQKCSLLSIKTGGCPENCSYCPQSAHYDTGLARQGLMPLEEVQQAVLAAKADGAQRFCMGAAWRNVKDGPEFDRVLDMVRIVKKENLEACVTLGMLTLDQAKRLKEAGLDAYNHNLDTGREYYSEIIQTRTFDDRLKTIQNVSSAGISVCCGGILGMGETVEHRCSLLAQLASMDPQPESVPINLLIPVEGTPLQEAPPVDPLEFIRTVAVARILMPRSRIRLSAGRLSLTKEAQILAFYVGANSIFLGEKLLTRANPTPDADESLIQLWGQSSQTSTLSGLVVQPSEANEELNDGQVSSPVHQTA